jgi:ATP-dependent RNA helicase RhlE
MDFPSFDYSRNCPFLILESRKSSVSTLPAHCGRWTIVRMDLAIHSHFHHKGHLMSFTPLGLSPAILKAVGDQGYSKPTPIQQAAIPAIINRKDVLGIARTGSGKTAGYILPVLDMLRTTAAAQHREPTVLVLVPTRELADQVQQVFQTFIPALPNRPTCLAVYGGSSINPQMQAIGKADIVIATPGRLLELLEKNAVRLSSISILVLDEADKMLNLGFKDEMDRILARLPVRRQNLLFSATLSDDLGLIQQVLLHDPQVINIASEPDAIAAINQVAYLVSAEKKGPLLRFLIKHKNLQQILIFASSTIKADSIVTKLRKNGIDAAAIHSKLSQQTRRDTLQQFKSGKLRALVATDLLARGIDIEFLPSVINYELPRSPKDYIHRIGRTGRAESVGDAISLVTPEEMPHFKVIQKKMGTHVKILHADQIDMHGY